MLLFALFFIGKIVGTPFREYLRYGRKKMSTRLHERAPSWTAVFYRLVIIVLKEALTFLVLSKRLRYEKKDWAVFLVSDFPFFNNGKFRK